LLRQLNIAQKEAMDFAPGRAAVREGMLELAFRACVGAVWGKRRAELVQGLVGGAIIALLHIFRV